MNENEIDVFWFDVKAQPFILQAFKDPTRLKRQDLEEVALAIVNRSWLDPTYYPKAASLCQDMCEKERGNQRDQMIPRYNFRNGLVIACRDVLQQRKSKAQSNKFQWICFCHFIAEVYKTIRVQGTTLRSFGTMMFDLITELSQLHNLQRFDQVELIHSIMLECGSDLDSDDNIQMDEVFKALREAFLHERTNTEIRLMLMQMIELRASRWTFSPEAREYYFGN